MTTPENITVAQDGEISQLGAERAKVTFGLGALVLAFFLPLPLLGGFTSVLDGVLFHGVTVAWVYAIAQFVVAISVARIYSAWAARFDDRLARVFEGSAE